MTTDRVVVVGAGVGGLAAAIDLARQGAAVTVIERAAGPGGKIRQVLAGGVGVDAGPTVFTMRWIFEALFADAGALLSDHLELIPAGVLARHAWRAGGRLDLFADIDRSADAIGEFAGPVEARGYRAFCARSADIYRTLRGTFIAAERPTPLDLVRRVGIGHLDALWRTAPMKTLWTALGEHFRDPRLRQLFGRYATYCGSSPMDAPATLMLVAHVEQDGVWLVRGGMLRVAAALHALGAALGATYRFETAVKEIIVSGGRAAGVILADGERVEADAVVFNGDVAALARRRLGPGAALAVADTPNEARSLSAVAWCLRARTSGFPLLHHNVFFAEDYAAEFDAIFRRRAVPAAPTVYVCAQDRGDDAAGPSDAERLLVLINAPADGDRRPYAADEMADYEERAFGLMQACGLTVDRRPEAIVATSPVGFETLFPATGGALYGRANHGGMTSFARNGAATRLPGLYVAGGSVHPGPGVPMAVMSGRLAAARLLQDRARGRL